MHRRGTADLSQKTKADEGSASAGLASWQVGSQRLLSKAKFSSAKVVGKVDIAAPEVHQMPWYIMWASTVLIAVSMAIVGWLMALIDTGLIGLKFNIVTATVMADAGLVPAVVVLALISGLLALVASSLVCFLAPICAGSGVPEAKGYMNGNSIPFLFSPRVLVVRIWAAVLAVAAGYPIGREGPMVGIGGQIGYGIVRLLGRPYMKTWLKLGSQDDSLSASLMVDERRFNYAKRVGYVLGAAAGIAVAFKAPIGGILYLLQEATVTSWSPELTARAFICTALAVMFFTQIQTEAGLGIHRLLIFGHGRSHKDRDWQWADIPYFVVLAAGCGWFAGLWSNGRFWVWKRRRKLHKRMDKKNESLGVSLRHFKIIEAVLFAMICACGMGFAPSMVHCTPCPDFCGTDGACSLENTPAGHSMQSNSTDPSHAQHSSHQRLLTHEVLTTSSVIMTTTITTTPTTMVSHSSLSGTGHNTGDHTGGQNSDHAGGLNSGGHDAGDHTGGQSSGGHDAADHTEGQNSGGHDAGDHAGGHNSGGHDAGDHTGGHSSGGHDADGGHSSGGHDAGDHAGGHNSGGHGADDHAGGHDAGDHAGGHSSGGHDADGHEGGHHCLSYVQYTCPSGEYNEMSTLLLTNAEAAVQHLFSRDAHTLRLTSLIITAMTYCVLSVLMSGIAVPMGAFVPAMLMGAALGRMLGESVQEAGFLSDPGLYAVCGAAATLAGVTHFSVAIVMLLVEGCNDLTMVGPMMIGIVVAHYTAKLLHHEAYDERLIAKKKIPYLDAEMSQSLDTSGLCAADLMDTVPYKAQLREHMSVEELREALEQKGSDGEQLSDFPILGDDDVCIGITRAARLESMIEACNKRNEKTAPASQKMEEEEMPDEMTAIKTTRAGIQEDHDDADDQGVSSWLNGIVRDVDPDALPIYRTMDATPYTIMETLPVPRLYPLFIRAHCVASCVLSKDGFFKGLITRSSLINASKVHENPSHKHLADSDSDSDKEGSDSEENKLPQKVMVSRPRTHHLPSKVILSALFMTVVVIVLTNFCMVMVDSYIVGWKFDTLQSVLSDQGLGIAILFLVSVSGALGCIVAVIVAYVQPVSEIQGSGIPEAKGFINGNVISKYFNPYGHIARVVCMTLAAAAGFPIGREGPMVAIGGMTGYAAAMIVAKPYVRKFIVRDWADSKGGSAFALSIDEERYAHVKLQGFILGAAAGIAVAFNAPIGGILYMFEEVTVTSWPPGFMFYVFSSCAFAVLLSRAMTNLVLDSVFHRLTFYVSDAEGHELYQYIDIPFFIILGALVGTCSALYSKGLFQVWKFRRRKAQELKDFQPFARIAETALYAAVVAGVVMLVPSLVGCHELPVSEAHGHGSGGSSSSGDHSTHGRLLSGGGHGLSYVQYTCPDGSYNEVATLTVTAWEGAIKHLFSPEEGALSMGSLCISVVTYACLAVCMPGLALPMGSFIPSMFIGAMIGRLMGTGLHQVLGLGTSHAGLYAIVGSGAFLGGFTHMTIAIVVLLVEACHDLSFTAPLMIGIFVGRAFSRLVSEHGYDEVLILAKGVPYLDSELPPSLEGADITASSIMQDIPGPAILPEEAPVEVLRAALDEEEVTDFPIVDTNHVCLGTITRGRLEEAVRLHGGMDREQTMRPGFTRRTTRVATEVALDDTNQGAGKYHSSEDQELALSKVFTKACQGSTIRINRLMDPTPYTILQDMPVARFLLLFTKVGAQTAVIIDKYATFVGLLSRQSFINAMQGAHHYSHKKHDAHHDHKHNKKHHNDDQSDAGSSCYSSDLDTDSPPSPSRKSAGVERPPPLPPPLSEPKDRNGHDREQGTRPKVTFGESNSETRKEDKKLSRQVNFGDKAPRHVNSDEDNGEKNSEVDMPPEVVHVSSRTLSNEQVQPSSSAPLQPSPNPTFLQRVVMMPVESLIGCIPGASPLNPMGSASRRYGSNGDPVVPGSLIGSARSPAIQGQPSHGV